MDPQNQEVGRKLAIASVAMMVLPLAAFAIAKYGSMHFLPNWIGDDTSKADQVGAGAAILVVNAVIASYCYMAYHEDDGNDSDRPRVGIYKQRTD